MLHGRLSLMIGARLIPLTPSHHQCEGRPPAFQASRARRATQQRRSKRDLLGRRTGARYPIYGTADEVTLLAIVITRDSGQSGIPERQKRQSLDGNDMRGGNLT